MRRWSQPVLVWLKLRRQVLCAVKCSSNTTWRARYVCAFSPNYKHIFFDSRPSSHICSFSPPYDFLNKYSLTNIVDVKFPSKQLRQYNGLITLTGFSCIVFYILQWNPKQEGDLTLFDRGFCQLRFQPVQVLCVALPKIVSRAQLIAPSPVSNGLWPCELLKSA